MERKLGLTYLVALGGMMATLEGILLCLALFFVPVTFGSPRPDAVVNGSADLEVSMRWIQPILGRAIVDTLAKHQYGNEIRDTMKAFKHSTMVEHHPYGVDPRTQVSTYAGAMEVDHAALVQWIMGRVLVELTRHAVRTGTLTKDGLSADVSQRIITIARQTGEKLDEAFRTERQARLGEAIVTETLNQKRTAQHNPEEVGLIF